MNLLTLKKERLEAKWVFDAGSPILSAPVFADLDDDGTNEIIFATKGGKVYVMKEDRILWLYDISEKLTETERLFSGEASDSIQGSPAVGDINKDNKLEIVFGSETGKLYVLSSEGKPLWRFRADAPIRTTPLLYDVNRDGKIEIVFGSSDGSVYVLDHAGNFLWGVKADSPVESSCIAVDKNSVQIIFGSNSGKIYSLSDGKVLWSFKAADKIISPAAAGNLYGDDRTFIVFGSFDKKLYVIDENGLLNWEYQTEGKIAAEPLLADINNDGKLEIIFGSCDANVYVLSSDGIKLWSYETDFWIASQPKVCDINSDSKSEVIVGSYDHSLYVFGTEGSFSLHYMPGLSSVMQQPGHYSELITREVGGYIGKKLFVYKTDSTITGVSVTKERGNERVVFATGNGKLIEVQYSKTR